MMLTKDKIEKEFNEFCSREHIVTRLSFLMPSGYKTAFGTYDFCKNTSFLNFDMLKNNPLWRFYFYHELRHAMQYLAPERFPKNIVESIYYVVLFDGTCFKYATNRWIKCQFDEKDKDFLNIYKSLPYELDANKFAYLETKKLSNYEQLNALRNLYKSTLPSVTISAKSLRSLFEEIDKKCK